MKRTFFGVAVLGLMAAGLLSSNATVSAADDEVKTTGDTKASVTFEGGSLSLTDATSTLDFGTFTVGQAAAKATNTTYIKVADFRGTNEGWTLSVTASGWNNDDLDKSTKLTVGTSDSPLTSEPQVAETKNAAGITTTDEKVTFSLPENVALTKGSYSNTLTWSVGSTGSATQE